MATRYLAKLSNADRSSLMQSLFDIQQGTCFICGNPIDISFDSSLDIDHTIPLAMQGKDDPSNFALTHSSCNRSKQASDLRVARVLSTFARIKNQCDIEKRVPNLNDVLRYYGGALYEMSLYRDYEKNEIVFHLPEVHDTKYYRVPVYKDEQSEVEYFFVNLPIQYLFHDDQINPRPIGNQLSKLIDEFFKKRPQLHVALGWITLDEHNKTRIRIFDGQHKTAAQVLLGTKYIPIRVFLNPDPDVLLTTNNNAGTTLRQVAFDKSVQRHLGSTIYKDRVERYQRDFGMSPDDMSFSELDLVNHFRGESREIRRFVLDSVRSGITQNQDNKLMEFVDFGGRANEKPMSYSAIEKTFYSFFIGQDLLDTSIDFNLSDDTNPRELEKTQITRLMNIVADEIMIGKFDTQLGSGQVESKVQKGELIPDNHLRSFRLSREEILYVWLSYIKQIIYQHYSLTGTPLPENRVFQQQFPERVWDLIRNYVKSLFELPLWVNHELSATVFGGKQSPKYWQTIFTTGRSPQGVVVLTQPFNLIEMSKDK